jgi:hypothetical protein
MKKGIVVSYIIICMTFVFANGPRKASHKPLPKLSGDEKINCNKANITYPNMLSHRMEEVIIGTTAHDFQASGGFGQRITLDSYLQAHINWMWMDMDQTYRSCAWNARRSDSSYYGETQASPSWSGYVQLDVTRDVDPNDHITDGVYFVKMTTDDYSAVKKVIVRR